MSDAMVDVVGMTVRYGAETAVRGLDLRVERGEVVGLIGPDGAGKTSTLRVLAGLLRASSGTVTVLGRDAWTHRRALHHRLGYLAQRFALYGDLTVDENVQFFALLLGVARWRPRRDQLLDRVGLSEFRTRQAERLSGGMKQKLALACSLMHEPEILLLDEPTTGVDPVTRREFWKLLGDLVADGLTLLIATPYLDEAERCSRVVLLHRGHTLADAPPAALPAALPGTVFQVAAEPRTLVASALASLDGVLDVQPFAARFHVRVDGHLDPSQIDRAIRQAGATVQEIRRIPATLEDVFLHLTRSGGAAAGEAA
ncbi:MAG: ABC transporter ATP-binding protein [Thermoanaerobaculaceae bacterium]|jgi:ABC-2 type transport system ATP-binding protein|nr:ABC transporter ATP-binding protein [Thermoanaerobaculaceae bacterium]